MRGGGGEIDGAVLEVHDRLLGACDEIAEPDDRPLDRRRIVERSGDLGQRAMQRLGIHPEGAHLVDEPVQAGGVDPNVLAEGPRVEGSEKTTEISGFGDGTWRSLGDGLVPGGLTLEGAAERTHAGGETRCPGGRVGGDGRDQFFGQRLQSLRQARGGGILLAVANGSPRVFQQLPGVGDGVESHHPGGALDGVPSRYMSWSRASETSPDASARAP